jgi:glycosyltransferase involved in cell wall biosynthesis
MRIIQVASSVADEAAGTTYCVLRMCEALGDAANDVRLMTVGSTLAPISPKFRHICCPQDFAESPVLKKLRMSKGLARAIDEATAEADVVHNHGLWQMPNIYPAKAAARYRKPLVVSTHGTLASKALRFSPHVKRLFWMAMQGPAIREAACLHATSEQEYLDIRRAGLRQPVAIIPMGIDLPAASGATRPQAAMRTMLYLGRLHPIKGLDMLLEAWRRVAVAFPEWRLRIVGPNEGNYRAQLERFVRDRGVPRIEFAGPRYGAAKAAEYEAAELAILPSRTENFGISVAEALAHRKPIVTTTGTPWAGIRANRCGWYVTPRADALESALREALAATPATLAAMGEAGHDWMARDFAWPAIARQMEAAYRWIGSGGAAPDFVRIDAR